MNENINKDRESVQDLSSPTGKVENEMGEMKKYTTTEVDIRQRQVAGQQASQERQKIMDMTTVMEELNDKKKRETNIVVYNVPESASSMSQERIEHGRQILKKIMNTCGVHENKLMRVIRLGKKTEGRDWPTLAVLTDVEVRNNIFRYIKELGKHENSEKIKVSYDFGSL